MCKMLGDAVILCYNSLMMPAHEVTAAPVTSLACARIIAKLRQYESEIRQLGVNRLFLFGSVARNEAKADSDIDLFFDYERERFGVFELMEVKERLADLLGRKVDVMTRDSLHKTLRARIEAESVAVF